MILPARRLGLGEFALRVAARPGRDGWLILVAPDVHTGTVAEELVEELAALQSTAVERAAGLESARALVRASKQAAQAILVASGLDSLPEEEWRHLDLLRSQLQREQPAVLVLTQPAVAQLMRMAPNLASWLAGSIWQLAENADSLTAEERERRLDALRNWSGRSDNEVLALALHRELPPEPEYAEWLVLLNRGDLLEL